MSIFSRFRIGPLRSHQHDELEGSTAPDKPKAPAPPDGGDGGGSGVGGVLGVVEWLGNKLPDPAFLFLGGAIIVMIASHIAAPSLPDRWAVEWEDVGNAAGGVDEHKSSIRRVKLDENGDPVYPAKVDSDGNVLLDENGEPVPDTEASPIEELASFKEVLVDGTPEAHLLIHDESGEPTTPVVDGSGEPIDFAERGWVVFEKRPVEKPVEGGGVDEDGNPETELVLEPTGKVLVASSLLTPNGLYWSLKTMENNFMGFAPLGVVLLGMLGIGVAEKTGLIAALLKMFMSGVPYQFLTPAMVFIGIMSSIASDAGYVVLPPLAAAIYLAAGRSPLVGIAAVFAGVSAGFNANLLITSLEPLMSEFSTEAAQLIDPSRNVAPTSNWWFMAVSTFVITGAGWLTTAMFVERRLEKKSPEEGGPDKAAAEAEAAKGDLTPKEKKAALWSVGLFFGVIVVVAVLSIIEGAPLHGQDGPFPRWVAAIVPILFIAFVLPGLLYGSLVGTVRNTKDATKHMIDSMAGMAPIIVLAFFAGQFVAYFGETNLGSMLAFAGGEWLFEQGLGAIPLILAFILLTMVFNMFVGSMSAKYALFAPIFVPMFMLTGIRPELTQVAYRIGDSVTNIITPLNAYLVIILVFMQKYAKNAGMGTLIAMMLPYSLVFAVVWSILLVVWMLLGAPLGLGDPVSVTVGQ
jgi:aminobenzoyl-glutamate transport protein